MLVNVRQFSSIRQKQNVGDSDSAKETDRRDMNDAFNFLRRIWIIWCAANVMNVENEWSEITDRPAIISSDESEVDVNILWFFFLTSWYKQMLEHWLA